MIDLLHTLMKEHARIGMLMKDIIAHINNHDYCLQRMADLRPLVFEHLRKESEDMMPEMQADAEGDIHLQRCLDKWHELFGFMSVVITQLFDNFDMYTRSELSGKIKECAAHLGEVINFEEALLFPAYSKIKLNDFNARGADIRVLRNSFPTEN